MSTPQNAAISKAPEIWTVWLIAAAAFAIAVWLSWTGFLGSDDDLYARAAIRWLQQGPFVGTTHFSLRLTTVLPVALSFRLFGVREWALILPTLLCGAAIASLYVFLACKILGRQWALFAIVLFVTAPLFALVNSTAGVDLTELLFDLTSITLFVVALDQQSRSAFLLMCGVALGFGWMSRETSIFLVALYGLLFLFEYRIKRSEYFYIAAGFLVVAGGEMLAYYLLTGNAFHRLEVSLHHDRVDRNAVTSLFDREGNVHVGGILGVFLDPFLMIFFNKEFGVLFWLAVPAGIWLFRSPTIPPSIRAALRLIAVAGLTWLLGMSLMVGKLYLVPRYILFPLCMAGLLVGAWIALELFPRSRRLAIAVVGVAVAVNFLAISLEDHNYMFPERTLVAYARSSNQAIFTDHETLRRGLFLLEQDGVGARVTDRQHRLGDLFFYVPDNAQFKERITGHEVRSYTDKVSYAPLPGEKIVAYFARPERWLAAGLESLGLAVILPRPVMAKLRGNLRAVFVYSADPS